MRRELEEELKNECFLAQMKIKSLNDMEDFFYNEEYYLTISYIEPLLGHKNKKKRLNISSNAFSC